MSKQYPGGIITKNPTAPTTASASGIWTAEQAQGYSKQGIWPRVASAPTIGTATAGTNNCASVTFSAPSCIGAGALTYKVISTPGCFQNTGASSPVVVSGLTNGSSYTFKAYGVTPGGTGPASNASNSITATNQNSQSYTSAGCYTWVAPALVTSVSVVTVGAGRSGFGGGALSYRNNYSVTPGNSYAVRVAAGSGGYVRSNFVNNCTVSAGSLACRTGCGGGNGGTGSCGDGGAGGYSGNGAAGSNFGAAAAGSGGGGGGGGAYYIGCCFQAGGGGGGVGLFGQGSSGAGGGGGSAADTYGRGGSSGSNGTAGTPGGAGGNGGGYGGGRANGSPGGGNSDGAVRIMWPGNTRSFPSTSAGAP